MFVSRKWFKRQEEHHMEQNGQGAQLLLRLQHDDASTPWTLTNASTTSSVRSGHSLQMQLFIDRRLLCNYNVDISNLDSDKIHALRCYNNVCVQY